MHHRYPLIKISLPIALPLILMALFLRVSELTAVPQVEISEQADLSSATSGLLPLAFPTKPPDLNKVTIGTPDFEGFVTLTGSPDAVPSLADVIVINLSSHNLITTTADAGGGFSASLFAPAGSSLLIKYETAGDRIERFWQVAVNGIADSTVENLNPLPGAILHVDPAPPGDGQLQSFASAGATFTEIPKGWAGWAITGTLKVPPGNPPPGLSAQAGDPITITAHLRVTTPGVDCTEPITNPVDASFHLRYLFDEDGVSAPWGMWFNSHLFTPSGLPIEHEAEGEWPELAFNTFSALTCTSAQTYEGVVQETINLPINLPDGFYRPEALINGIQPVSSNIPLAVVWFHFDPRADFPTLIVGTPDAPRIPWSILADYPLNGHRGVQANEDAGQAAMPTRVVFAPHQVVIPRLDERSGQPLVYRLEPGSNWLSATDRRLPPPPHFPINLPSGELIVEILKPDGTLDQLGPALIQQSSVRTPTTPGGSDLAEGTGQIGDLYHLTTMDDSFAYSFDQYGPHTIFVSGHVEDIYGIPYAVGGTYEVVVARIMDLDPGQLPTTPYQQGDYFSPGLHVFPPVPADVHIEVTHLPFSDPNSVVTTTISGQANRFGYFHPDPNAPENAPFSFNSPGEFRVDYTASYLDPDGTLWMGTTSWGSVVEGTGPDAPDIVAHGRRGMDYHGSTINDMPIWFRVQDLPPEKIGIEMYYPYFSGDIHWGNEDPEPPDATDSIHTILTLAEKPGVNNTIYDVLRNHFDPLPRSCYRWPPDGCDAAGLEKRIEIGEAPLFITTQSGIDPAVEPEDIDLWGYWYGSSQRPDVHVREIISEDSMGTAYWRFNDTYGYQIGQSADGDQPGDIKWEFGGVVLRTPDQAISEYAIYSSLWVLLPHGCDAYGCTRVTPPFQDATGASINGGPIMNLLGEEIDMLFLPKGVRPGDILEIGDTFSFSGHVGPPLNSQVSITVTTPSQNQITGDWHTNKIGWLYDPTFDFTVTEPGRWSVEVFVKHDQPYVGNGVIPQSHNTGSVLGAMRYSNTYDFYVVPPDTHRLSILTPSPGYITWPAGEIEPIPIALRAPSGSTEVHYVIHDKGIVMEQGRLTPDPDGFFSLVYDAAALHGQFPMLSLTAREGRWEGLSDEVSINFLAVGGADLVGNTLTLIGEEVFVEIEDQVQNYLPVIWRAPPS